MHDEFIAEFADILSKSLRKQIEHKHLPMSVGIEKEIGINFVRVLKECKEELSKEKIKCVKSELSFSSNQQKLISNFANKLKEIFSEVGDMSPGSNAALWSGPAQKQASKAGFDFAKTIPGSVVNQVMTSLIKHFAEKAYSKEMDEESLLDTALLLAMWDAHYPCYMHKVRMVMLAFF